MDSDGADTCQITSNEEFKIKGAARRGDKGKRKTDHGEQQDQCTICLQPITERAIAVPCNHLSFDFICLASWLYEQPKCPLCKTDLTEVQYDWRSPSDFKTFRLPPAGLSHPRDNQQQQLRPRPLRSEHVPTFNPTSNPSLTRRREVHSSKLYSLHIGTNPLSGYRDFTPSDFDSSPKLQSRARTFLRRELLVFTFLDGAPSPSPNQRVHRGHTGSQGGMSRRRNERSFLIELIVSLLRKREIKGSDGLLEEFVGEFLGRGNARLLLHELGSWLRSPFERLEEWDGRVEYSRPLEG